MVKAFQQHALLSNTLVSIPVFSGEKNLFNPWVTAVENAAKLLNQDPIDVAMMKLTSAPLQVAMHLWDTVTNVMWKDFQKELAVNFSPLPYDSHAIQAFANLIQGSEEFLTFYVQWAFSLLIWINQMSDMSAIQA